MAFEAPARIGEGEGAAAPPAGPSAPRSVGVPAGGKLHRSRQKVTLAELRREQAQEGQGADAGDGDGAGDGAAWGGDPEFPAHPGRSSPPGPSSVLDPGTEPSGRPASGEAAGAQSGAGDPKLGVGGPDDGLDPPSPDPDDEPEPSGQSTTAGSAPVPRVAESPVAVPSSPADDSLIPSLDADPALKEDTAHLMGDLVEASGLDPGDDPVPPSPSASAPVPARKRSTEFRPFSLQAILGYTDKGQPHDPELEQDLFDEMKRAGVDISEFRAMQSKAFTDDNRDAAIAQFQSRFHSSVEQFEQWTRAAVVRVADRQRQATEVSKSLLKAATGISLLLQKLDEDLTGLQIRQAGWVSEFEAQLGSFLVKPEADAKAQVETIGEMVDSVRSGAAELVRLLYDLQHRSRDILQNDRAIVDQYTGLTQSLQRTLIVYSALSGVGGALVGSLIGFLLFLWSGGGAS